MHSYSVEGIVLKRLNFGEADRILTLFTRDSGKITVLAKGIRKISSKRAGSLELFNHIKCNLVRGKGELDTLIEVELHHPFSSWRKHLGRINIAYQTCEVIDKLTPEHQPHPQIFEILKYCLSQIGQLDSNWKLTTDDWLLQILIELGFWPKDRKFSGDVQKFIEDLINRPLNSPKLLNKLK